MEDRFKFRVWHKKRKKIYEVLHLHVGDLFNGGDWATAKGFNIITQQDMHIAIQPEDCLLMQCTGLKDKNGKLIYEGDIVEIATEEENAIIKWEKDTANFSIHILNENVIANFDNYWSYQLEVLGNIYEGKYLLGEENEEATRD